MGRTTPPGQTASPRFRFAGIRLSKHGHIRAPPAPFSRRTHQDRPGGTILPENSKATGDATESMAIHELVCRGYLVSVPFGDNSKYDLVVDDEGTLYRVQCKTAWRTTRNTIRFNTHSQTTRDGQYHESTYDGEIDAFVVRFPETETLYWVDIEDAADKKTSLRFEAKIDHPAINWADDFELGDELPS